MARLDCCATGVTPELARARRRPYPHGARARRRITALSFGQRCNTYRKSPRRCWIGAKSDRVIAIGASTGGTEAIARTLESLPPDTPAIIIAQHIPEVFSERFARRLDEGSALSVREARDGDPLALGTASIAPRNFHLRVVRSGAKDHCRVTQDERSNRHRPCVEERMLALAVNGR